MGKERGEKLVKVYFNGRTVEKARKLDWESQGMRVSRVLTQMNECEPRLSRNFQQNLN